ncbi:enoyl-CoA hydratase/isomerase family protein [Flammeovirga sp. MY04]|uniref:enoyl-CoA hydratase/isomerase family protein n=1 Tax=Flammeovirga sp. MY04 TaxID=1191459 RepID=UPI0008063C33|nr:enoyl-CoA hydratase-related protein [Flammeovirga sp. MY04]ANQ49760.1 enoyl-CoA hydratase/isomerase family protein [Flammeovirga sp. MY04]
MNITTINNYFITLQIINRVGYILINRPKANCYDIHFMKQLISCLKEAEQNSEVKVIVIKSALDKFFCAGADVKVFQSNTTEENKLMVDHAKLSAKLISESKKVTIAAINGHALGGGLELAMACDLRLAKEGNYLLGLPEIKLGLMPGNGGSQRLIRLIGKSKALEMLVTGDPVQPEEALRVGLVNHLYTQETFENEVIVFAEKLSKGPSMAITASKESVYKGLELSMEEGLKLESQLVDQLYDTEDAKEGNLAFVEKREPNFR